MKKTLAIFSLTSCEGCQFEMLNHYNDFEAMLKFYDVKNFRLGQEDNFDGPFDVAIVEGNPEGERQKNFLKKIRKESKVIIALGTCAHLGGIQSQRNRLPIKFTGKEDTKTVLDIIKIDYVIPGCPINHKELYSCLADIHWGKVFRLPDLAVCFECRQNENDCLLKNKKPCLGPITRMGCNSVCINAGVGCLGCRGATPEPNINEIEQELSQIVEKDEVENLLTIYGNLK